jgi:uncharacterized RDD family membrane protein YckC
MAWYYFLNGANQGPVDAAELADLHRKNVIAMETPVWTEGMADWTPYQNSSLLSGSAASAATATQVCAQCGQRFPESEMLRYENSWVCAACKPLFFQRIKEGVAPAHSFAYAGFWIRFVAVFIDGLIVDFFVLLPLILIFGLPGLMHKTPSAVVNTSIIIVQYVVPALYEILFIGSMGATPGKMLMKIKVITADGGRVSYGRSTGRYFAKMLSGIILGIGYLMVAWDDEKRALHDHICKTRVIKTSGQ